MYFYQILCLESCPGFQGWTYSSVVEIPLATLVEITLRKRRVFGMVLCQVLLTSEESILPIDRVYPGKFLMSQEKIQAILSLSQLYGVPLFKIFQLFFSKDSFSSLSTYNGDTLGNRPIQMPRMGQGSLIVGGDIAASLVHEGLHIFPSDRLDIYGIASQESVISRDLTRKTKQNLWIDMLTNTQKRRIGGREVLRFPIEGFSDIYYYLPHVNSVYYYMLHHYLIIDILEALRIYTGVNIHIVAPRLSSQLMGLYHIRQYHLS